MKAKPEQSPDAGILNTTVGAIAPLVLSYTAGEDVELDRQLIDADCIGTAAHVTMLAAMPLRPRLFSAAQRDRVLDGLVRIMRDARLGQFSISLQDQDVHLAVERTLTARMGELGRKVHTGRSRNDQVAVDLRLFAREQILATMDEMAMLADVLLKFGYRHRAVPMVGRTHMQPATPSSVGLWASAFAEGLLEDQVMLRAAYDVNDRCPLGSAAGYGVPLPIDRRLTSDLLGFHRPYHNVICAANGRGKLEMTALMALGQIMITLSRLAQDLMIFTMPEFGYFHLPPAMCTGSSIMPQKNNPDVLELLRARAARLTADAMAVAEMTRALPSGYNRDLQETKAPFMRGFLLARSSLRVMVPLIAGLRADRGALTRGFSPSVFATDQALALVRRGRPFRDAYRHVKEHLAELESADPAVALAEKDHLGAPAGLDWAMMRREVVALRRMVNIERRRYFSRISRLMRIQWRGSDQALA